jgi:putative tricarboxylic transport membrane protein
MRIHDGLIGAVFLALALAVLWHIQDFPPAPGQPYGPALFPGLIAAGLAASSALLMLTSLRARPPSEQAVARGYRFLPFAITLASLVFYALVVSKLGFLITASLMLCALLAAYRVRAALILPIAVLVSLIVHTGFYKLLKVPLPWGVLQSVAW